MKNTPRKVTKFDVSGLASTKKEKEEEQTNSFRGFEPEANGRAEKKNGIRSLQANFLPRKTAFGPVMCTKKGKGKKMELTGLKPRASGSGINRADTYPLSYRNNFVNCHPETHESANAQLDVAYCAALPSLLFISIAHKGVTVRFRPQVPYLKLLPTPTPMGGFRIYL